MVVQSRKFGKKLISKQQIKVNLNLCIASKSKIMFHTNSRNSYKFVPSESPSASSAMNNTESQKSDSYSTGNRNPYKSGIKSQHISVHGGNKQLPSIKHIASNRVNRRPARKFNYQEKPQKLNLEIIKESTVKQNMYKTRQSRKL